MFEFMTSTTKLNNFLPYPRHLLLSPLSETAVKVYILLLSRAQLSQRDSKYYDNKGRVFIFYPQEDIAREIGKSLSTVKAALKNLECANLILRVSQGVGNASKIYVKIKSVSTENAFSDSQEVHFLTSEKLAVNKKNNTKQNTYPAKNKFHNFHQRDYDFDELEQLLTDP